MRSSPVLLLIDIPSRLALRYERSLPGMVICKGVMRIGEEDKPCPALGDLAKELELYRKEGRVDEPEQKTA